MTRTGAAGRALTMLLAVMLLVTATGCGESQTTSEARQKQELDAYGAQVNAWGEEILAWFPSEEVKEFSPFYAGGRAVSANSRWPKEYIWERDVVLFEDGHRTPTQLADDLDTWLEAQGWARDRKRERPGTERRFTREYYREGYYLRVDVYVAPPPHIRLVSFTLASPDTHTKKSKAPS